MISEIIGKWCSENQLSINDEQLDRFEKYARMLVEWNEKMNLTAITEEKEIAVKHFIDSISLLACCRIPEGASVIDIGTGAGFPGIPLKIMRPDIKLTLLDSLNKRLIFLEEVSKALDLTTELIHARAEEYGRKDSCRDSFDIAVSRAVANLPALCEYCLPYVKPGGQFIAMKGPDGENELSMSENAIKQLCSEKENSIKLILPDKSMRTIIILRKLSPTPAKYPRRGIKISKSPL